MKKIKKRLTKAAKEINEAKKAREQKEAKEQAKLPPSRPRFKVERAAKVRRWIQEAAYATATQTKDTAVWAAEETIEWYRARKTGYVAEGEKKEGSADLIDAEEMHDSQEELIEESEGTSEDSFLAEDPEKDTTNIPLTVFNLVNFAFGPYIVILPYALHFNGWYFCAPLMFALAAIVWMSMSLLIRSSRMYELTSLTEIAHVIGGKPAFYVICVLSVCHYIGIIAVFNVLLKVNVTKFVLYLNPLDDEEKIQDFRLYVFLIIISCLLPLMLIRKVSQITKLSVTSFGLMLYCLGVVIYYSQETPENYAQIEKKWEWKSPEAVRGTSVFMFAFAMHRTCMEMYTALQANSVARWNFAFAVSLGFVSILMTAFTYSGYYIFNQYTQGDVLENFCSDDSVYGVRLLISVVIVFAYPGVVQKARIICRRVLKKRQSTFFFYLTTLGIMLAAAGLSYPTDCVATLVELLGPSFSTLFTITLPALFYIKVPHKQDLVILNVAAMFLVYFGSLLSLYGFIVACFKMPSIITLCSWGVDMYYCKEEEKTIYV